MLELKPFTEDDCERLIGWIPDARFLMLWAGPAMHRGRWTENNSPLPLNARADIDILVRPCGDEFWNLITMELRKEERESQRSSTSGKTIPRSGICSN